MSTFYKPKIICISGKARSGKDTIAGILRSFFEKDQQKALIVHYADLLKFIASNYAGWDTVKDEYGRTLLQYLGTDIVRKENEDFWVNFVAQAINFTSSVVKYDYIIIPDCRFPNEIDYWLDNDYEVYWLEVFREQESNLTENQKNHASEIGLNTYNRISPYTILNNGPLEDLEACIRRAMNKFIYLHKFGS